MIFDTVSIIDWEYAGYFPPGFELPLWNVHPHEIRHMAMDVMDGDLACLGRPISDKIN